MIARPRLADTSQQLKKKAIEHTRKVSRLYNATVDAMLAEPWDYKPLPLGAHAIKWMTQKMKRDLLEVREWHTRVPGIVIDRLPRLIHTQRINGKPESHK